MAEPAFLYSSTEQTGRGRHSNRTDFCFSKPSELPITGTIHDFNGPRNFDITPDGKHLVVVVPASPLEPSQQATSQINIVLNWLEELKQRVPAK